MPKSCHDFYLPVCLADRLPVLSQSPQLWNGEIIDTVFTYSHLENLSYDWVKLAPNWTNLELSKISFCVFWLAGPKCSETDLLKVPGLSYLWPIGCNLDDKFDISDVDNMSNLYSRASIVSCISDWCFIQKSGGTNFLFKQIYICIYFFFEKTQTFFYKKKKEDQTSTSEKAVKRVW